MDKALSEVNRQRVLALARSARLPHTIIIEGADPAQRNEAAVLITAAAVCTSGERPCLSCTPCQKVLEGHHPDVIIPQPSKRLKSGIVSLEDLRKEYLSSVSIKPNEAPIKVYIFHDADRLLREDSQNTLLKVIEEPPQDILFLFTVQKAESMLSTVLSRARVLTLKDSGETDEEAQAAAGEIVSGMIALYEYELLASLAPFKDKEKLKAAITALNEKLRMAICFHSGVMTDDEEAKKLAKKLNREQILAVMDTNHEAIQKLKTNVNLQLLTTWLCTQYRRITWQK